MAALESVWASDFEVGTDKRRGKRIFQKRTQDESDFCLHGGVRVCKGKSKLFGIVWRDLKRVKSVWISQDPGDSLFECSACFKLTG